MEFKVQSPRPQTRYLGFMVSAQGIQPNEENATNTDNEQPKNVKQVRSFIGTLSYTS